jgi:hypothetical protein
MAIIIRRLEEHDEVENFDCGDEPLNNYLKRHAAKYGFVPLQGAAESGPQRMFLDIRTVRAALRP